MLLDDFIECGEHRGDCVVARPDIPLRISARQFLYKVPHRIFPCKQICQFNVWHQKDLQYWTWMDMVKEVLVLTFGVVSIWVQVHCSLQARAIGNP